MGHALGFEQCYMRYWMKKCGCNIHYNDYSRQSERRSFANAHLAADSVCGASHQKFILAWILPSVHMSLTKVSTGTMAIVMSAYTWVNVSYWTPNMGIYLRLAPFWSKCGKLDVPFSKNWAFAPQLGVLIPQRDDEFISVCSQSNDKECSVFS